MAKQMEGDNQQRRAAARAARAKGELPSGHGATTGASKQRTHIGNGGDQRDRLAAIQRGEVKQAGRDVPRPLRGKGRRKEADVPPGP